MTTTARRRLGPLSAVLALGLLISACGDSSSNDSAPTTTAAVTSSDEGTPVSGGTVVWGLEAETDGLNPISGRWVVSGHVMASAIFDPLVTLDDAGEPVPYLAESLEPSDDFLVWTITLPEGVLFHDGTELTAEAAADALRLHLDSAMTGDAVTNVASVEATGPLTVTVNMAEPWAAFPYTLTTQVGYVPAPSMLDEPNDARTPVGTGPFRFQAWDYGTSFRASKNPDYWRTDDNGVQLPYLDAIEFRPISDPQSRTNALLNNDIDILSTAAPQEIQRLQSAPGIETLTYDQGEKQFVMLNTSTAPFSSETARLAVAHATDPETIREETGYGFAAPIDQIWAEGSVGYEQDPGYLGFDLERAKGLVAQYETETGQPLTFTYTVDDTTNVAATQLLIEMWAEAGIEAQVKTVTQADSPVVGALGQFEAIDWRFFGAIDPDMEYVWLTSKSIDPTGISLNFSQFSDPAIDSALDVGRSTVDTDERHAAYSEIARILNENVPYVWLYGVTSAIASTESVHGYGAAANGSIQTLGPKTWVATLWKN
jgi:peptide/nickel transport system substrate-binding protein